MFNKTGGHPLFITYAVQLLKEQSDLSLLDQYDNFTTTIENMYISSWDQIKTNQNIIDILAIISRFRLSFDPENFLAFATRPDLVRFNEKFSHYFKKGKVWSFYHNSFRQFLLQKTKETPFGTIDDNLHKEYYKKLSEILEKTKDEIVSWELIYVLFHAGEKQKIIDIATQEYFREQCFKLRPYNEIKDDISILLQISKDDMDFTILLRCLLIEKELQDREQVLGELDIVTLLFNTYGITYFLGLIQNPVDKFSTKDYFSIVSYLYHNGCTDEARLIYEQYIPLHFLSGNTSHPYYHDNSESLLDSWIGVAILFHPISEIIKYIEQVKVEKNNFPKEETIHHEVLHEYLVEVLSHELIFWGNSQMVVDFIENNHIKKKYTSVVFNMCLQIEYKRLYKNDGNIHKATFLIIEEYSKNHELNEIELLQLGEFYFKNNDIEKSKYYCSKIRQITVADTNDYSGNHWFYKTIRLNRLLAELNIINSPQEIIPNPEDEHYLGNALYLRILIIFSQYEGIINRGGKIGLYDFKKHVEYAIRVLQKPYHETREWYSWYTLEKTFSEFYTYIIGIGNKNGKDSIEALKEIFIKSWNSNTFWQLDTERVIIKELIKSGAAKNDLVPVLENLFERARNDTNADALVSSYSDFIKTFYELKIEKNYPELLRNLLQGSFAIHDRKDYQIQDWLFWLELYAKKYPEKASNDLDNFLCALSNLYDEKGGDNADAIQKLICLAASINPSRAFYMLKWLLDKGTCDYTSSLIGFISGLLTLDASLFTEYFLIFQKLIIPFESGTSSDVIKILIDSLYKEGKHNEIEKHLLSLINVINTELVSNSRRKWLEDIKSTVLKHNSENPMILKTIEKYIEIAPEIREMEYSEITTFRKDFKDFNELFFYLEKKR